MNLELWREALQYHLPVSEYVVKAAVDSKL